ncbi:Thymidylate kinase [uncultured archaeon]|nr:Thymidylate kinase [uncultured archaeon]
MMLIRNQKPKGIKKKISKKCITIAFLGIDGAGKSTNAEKINSWLNENGVKCMIIPFHNWIFADKIKKRFGKYVDIGRKKESLRPYAPPRYSFPAIVKPLIAMLDNILMYYLSKRKYENYDVIIFDRFICASLIKSKALDYHAEWLRPIWQNIRTDISIVLDIPIQRSLKTINDRKDHILYTAEQLSCEREEYLKLARKSGYIMFDSSKPFEDVNNEIKNYLRDTILLPSEAT